MIDHTRRTVLAAVGTGLAMSASAGIGGAQNESDKEDNRIRVVHLSPDAPTVDVYVDGELAFESVEPFATEPITCPPNRGRTRSRSSRRANTPTRQFSKPKSRSNRASTPSPRSARCVR